MDNPVYRAALFSTAFESWRRRYHKYPVYLPTEALAARPLSIRKIIPRMAAEAGKPELASVSRLMHRELEHIAHPDCEEFKSRCRVDQAAREELGTAKNPILPADDLNYDPDTDITDVSVSAVFRGISREQAERLIALAEPPEWPNASGDFFREIRLGKLGDGGFDPDPNPAALMKEEVYQFQETVDWNWAPQVDGSGGMINVLEYKRIAVGAPKRPSRAKHMDDVLDEIAREFSRRKGKEALAFKEEVKAALASIRADCSFEEKDWQGEKKDWMGQEVHYEYRLVCCLQSKFVSTWSLGGIDVDEGYYRSVWCPYKEDPTSGALFTRIQKKLRYTSQANAFPGHSKILNLMAPALGSMLLKQCAFHSVIRELEKLPKIAPRDA